MKSFILGLVLMAFGGVSFAASPTSIVELLPYSNETSGVVTCTTGSVSAVTVSSSVITRIDSVFNTAAESACKASYNRAEITVQNNGTSPVFCGYSASGVTVSNSFSLSAGAVWTWKLGKGMGVYCLNTAGAAGTLIVGGLAWR